MSLNVNKWNVLLRFCSSVFLLFLHYSLPSPISSAPSLPRIGLLLFPPPITPSVLSPSTLRLGPLIVRTTSLGLLSSHVTYLTKPGPATATVGTRYAILPLLLRTPCFAVTVPWLLVSSCSCSRRSFFYYVFLSGFMTRTATPPDVWSLPPDADADTLTPHPAYWLTDFRCLHPFIFALFERLAASRSTCAEFVQDFSWLSGYFFPTHPLAA